MAKRKVDVYLNGARIRVHNKRIVFEEVDNKVMIQFNFADENAETPACGHKCHRGKIRETFIQMSTEVMDLLVHTYISKKRLELEFELEKTEKAKEK